MGDIWLHRLPEFLARRNVTVELVDGWEQRARSTGGLDGMRGVIVHHSAGAINGALSGAVRYATVTATDRPIGNGTVSRPKDGPRLVLWAGGAANTAGRGGPLLSSRGLIPLDAGNRLTVSWEAENNGTTEPWGDDMCDLYVQAVAATIEWANATTPGVPLTAGDVWAHHEWAPSRKIDPAGPSRFNGHRARTKWDMDMFRGEVFLALLSMITPEPPVPGPGTYTVQAGDGWWAVSRALGVSIAELQAFNGVTVLHPGMVIRSPVAPPPPVVLRPDVPQPPIRFGDDNAQVDQLVGITRFWGWYPNPEIPSARGYDDRLMIGVAHLQGALGVVGDLGQWDIPTAVAYSGFLDAMQGLACGWPATSNPGDRDERVVGLQRRLVTGGWYTARVDGVYGPVTQQAVQQMQKHLRARGWYTGPLDGRYGPMTRDAACRLG